MILPRRDDDPMTTVDSVEFFEEYLAGRCTRQQLVDGVVRQLDRSDMKLTDVLRSMLVEAAGYLTKGELIEQVALAETDRRGWEDYERWCFDELDARRMRDAEEGVEAGVLW